MPEQFDCLPFQPDHIIAIKHDGPTNEVNLAWSCLDCNSFKSSNVAGVADSGEIVRLFHPRLDNWSEYFYWQGAILQAKNPIASATIKVLRINLARRVALREQLIVEGVFPPV
jgi:hypothetical protein